MTSWYVLVGKSVHSSGWLSGRSCSKWECESGYSDHPPFYEGRNGSPRHTLWHSPPGTSMCPCIKQARILLLKKMSSAHERVNLGGGSGLCIGTRESSSGGVASSDSDVGNRALPTEVGSWGLSQPHLTSGGWTDHSPLLLEWGTCGAPSLFHRAPLGASQNGHNIFGALWPVPLFPQLILLSSLGVILRSAGGR